MMYVGIDYHKKYSVASVVDEAGVRILEARINGNSADGFAEFFHNIPKPCKVVMEACWSWGRLYDMLEPMAGIEEIVLAHPYKTRIIAEAQIKTDKLDARALAQLLRANLIARAWIPSRRTRQRKDLLRHRLYWVRMRTRLRNRLHVLLDRHPEIALPQVSDIFGVKGMKALRALQLAAPDQQLLQQHLELLDLLREQIRQAEKQVAQENAADANTLLLESIPGLGPILAAVVAAEIEKVERFVSSSKLLGYAGLVPTTHSSGGKTYQGPLLPMCNKWLRWALVEGSWVAVGCSSYFGQLYKHQRARGKAANTAIVIVARRMAQIIWQLLSQKRSYQERSLVVAAFPDRSQRGLVAI